MDVVIDLQTLSVGTVTSIGLFIVGMVIAMIATLDILKFTSIFKSTKTTPERMLICLVPILTMDTMSALGNAISGFWGDALPAFAFLFFFGSILIRHIRSKKSHNNSLNTDAGDAGAG